MNEKNASESLKIPVKYVDGFKTITEVPVGDWIDLAAGEDVDLFYGYIGNISLGVAMQLPPGYEAHVLPRSSTFKRYGIVMVNSMGIIDNSYCGDDDVWRFPAMCVRPMAGTTIHKGERIAQFRIVKKQPAVEFVEVDILGNKNRGGFGSTGT